MRFGAQGDRPTARCLDCGSLERHRALVRLLSSLPRFHAAGRCLEVAPLNREVYGGFLRRHGWRYVCTDKWRTGNPHDPRAVGFIDFEADLTAMSMIDDASVDLLIVQHVIEEIPAYMTALAEIARVLAPGGVALMEIPYDRIRTDSRRTPPNHFGNVWQFGADLLRDVRQLLPATEVVPFTEGEFRGEIFVATKRPTDPVRPHLPRRVLLTHGHDATFASDLTRALELLRATGERLLTVDEYLAGHSGTLLTIDDGHPNDLERGLPILERFDAQAVSFLIPLTERLEPRVADWSLWRAAWPRIEVGAHSLTHAKVGTAADGERDERFDANVLATHAAPVFAAQPGLAAREYLPHRGRAERDAESRQRRVAEIGFARQYIERQLGRPVRLFSFPWGAWDPVSVEVVREAGYEAAFATHRTDGSPFTVPRQLLREFLAERMASQAG